MQVFPLGAKYAKICKNAYFLIYFTMQKNANYGELLLSLLGVTAPPK